MDDRLTALSHDATTPLQAPDSTAPCNLSVSREHHEILETEQVVTIDELERCLQRPWEPVQDEARQPDATGEDLPVCRALTMNLIAVAPSADESLLRSHFQRLLHDSPCVAFLLLLDDRPSDLRTRFSTVIDATADERTILLEQVTMVVGRDDRRRVASLLRPVLVHDLPTVIFWADRLPRETGFMTELARLGNRLIYDSALLEDPRHDSIRITGLAPESTDLAELRTKPWRRSLAEAFEHVTWPPLTAVHATISHTGNRGTNAGSVALARWLEDRLDARVTLRTVVSQRSPSFEPCSVELRFDDVCIEVRHEWPTPSLRTTVTLADQCLLPFTVTSRPLSRGALLAQASAQFEATTH